MLENDYRRFTSPAVLKKISGQRLRDFLSRFEPFFSNRKIELPPATSTSPDEDDSYDYTALSRAIARPDRDSPPGMVDALHLINEMCSESAHDAMIEAIAERKLKIDLPADVTTAEIALAIWMMDKALVYNLSVEELYTVRRKYEFYRAETTARPPFAFQNPTDQQIAAICKAIDKTLSDTRRGEGSRLYIYNEADEPVVRILVEHGDPCKREGNYINNKPETLLRRPGVFDSVHFSKETGELAINCESKTIIKKYLKVFGNYIFQKEDAFKPASKYQLKPLWEDGDKCLSVAGITGDPLHKVVLREVTIAWNREQKDFETRKALDLFAAMKARSLTFQQPKNGVGEIIRVKFDVYFKNDPAKPKRLLILPPRDAQYERDEEGKVLEEWMRKRKFTIEPVITQAKKGASDGAAVVALAGNTANSAGRSLAAKAGN